MDGLQGEIVAPDGFRRCRIHRSQGAGCLRAFHELFDAVLDASLNEQAALHPVPGLSQVGVASRDKDRDIRSIDVEGRQNFETLLNLFDVIEEKLLDRAR
jgi:hypothetical protein